MKKVLLTGAMGMVGRAIAARLVNQDVQLIAHDRSTMQGLSDALIKVRGDLRDTHALYRLLRTHDVDTVIHAGGISGPMLLREDPYQLAEVNVIASIQLIEAARSCGVRRFVYMSSAAAYGDMHGRTHNDSPVTEDTALRPKDVYGASKGAVELILAGYRSQCDFDGVSLRLANVYGPGRQTTCAVKQMLEDALAARATRFDWGAGEYRPYCYIDDTIDAIIAAAKAGVIQRPVYNIAGPEYVAMEDVAAAVQKAVPGAQISFEPGLSAHGYRRDALDLGAAAQDFGFKPVIGIDEGVVRYRNWLQANS
jgi:nucleoside-diphosphate-sugar epimerase